MTDGPLTLAIDVGGSGLKATVLAPDGEMLSERVRRDTPYPCTPPVLLDELDALAKTQPDYDRVSVGFPGAIRRGIVRDVTAFVRPAPGEPKDPKLIKQWIGYDLQSALAQRFGKPVRVANDADVQGLGCVSGKGDELVITLGTGFGSVLFVDGHRIHLELGHHPFRKGKTYEEELGIKALKKKGQRKWNKTLREAIDELARAFNFDRLYIGGGNAAQIEFKLPPNVEVVSNTDGLLGGIKLWQNQKSPK